MPAPRAVLADLLQYGLDPTKEHKTTNANGRLGKDSNVVLTKAVIQTVEVQPVQQVVEHEPEVVEFEQKIDEPKIDDIVEQPVAEVVVLEEVKNTSKSEELVNDQLSKSILESEDTKLSEKVVEESTKKRGKKSLDK